MDEHRAPLTLRRFTRADFPTYCQWFADADLARHLGPIDDEWLEAALQDPGYVLFAAVESGRLAGVCGVTTATTEHAFHVVTELAVDPARRRSGIAARMLAAVLHDVSCRASKPWQAYVSRHNPAAAAFLVATGWRRCADINNDDEMLAFAHDPADSSSS